MYVPDVTVKRLQELLEQLEEVCEQARELQRSVKQTLADSRRRDRLDLGQTAPPRTKPRAK